MHTVKCKLFLHASHYFCFCNVFVVVIFSIVFFNIVVYIKYILSNSFNLLFFPLVSGNSTLCVIIKKLALHYAGKKLFFLLLISSKRKAFSFHF